MISDKQLKVSLLIILLFVLGFTLYIFKYHDFFNKKSFLSGDEPHYIMMAESLLQDNDFNLKNDYILGREQKYYSENDLFPHVSPRLDINGEKWYSIHPIGLPLLIALPFKYFGLPGIRVVLALLQLASIYFFYLVLKKYTDSNTKVLVGLLLLISCSAFWQNIGVVFPDLILVTILLFSIVLFGRKDLFSNILLGIVLVAGLAIHTRIFIVTAPIIAMHFLYLFKQKGIKRLLIDYWPALIALLIPAIFYERYLFINYGSLSPSALYGNNGQIFGANIFSNFIAIFLDRAKGLLVYFPAVLLLGPYAYIYSKKIYYHLIKTKLKEYKINDYLFIGFAIGCGALLITQLGFTDWSGSYAPNTRYALIVIFLTIFIISKNFNFNNIYQRFALFFVIVLNVISLRFYFSKFYWFIDDTIENYILGQAPFLRALPKFSVISAQTPINHIYRSLIIFLAYLMVSAALVKLFTLGDSKPTKLNRISASKK
jgi:hypothetical protein